MSSQHDAGTPARGRISRALLWLDNTGQWDSKLIAVALTLPLTGLGALLGLISGDVGAGLVVGFLTGCALAVLVGVAAAVVGARSRQSSGPPHRNRSSA